MMEPSKATSIIDQMIARDGFTAWLGAIRLAEGEGFCNLQMIVRREMCNGFGIAHGGICYSLADSALAFASNSHGQQAVSIETSISYLKPVNEGDAITAAAVEKSLGRNIAVYEVSIQNQAGQLVALFKGTVYRKNMQWV
ncbi:MAG: hydroxyphenylacetyl-CoA thioesterase PaaI [Chitinophagaceae bacterium]